MVRRSYGVVALLVGAVVIAGLAFHLTALRSETIHVAEREALNLRGALVEHVVQTLTSIDLSLLGIAREMSASSEDIASSRLLRGGLETRRDVLSNVLAYVVADVDGKVIASSGGDWINSLSELAPPEFWSGAAVNDHTLSAPRRDLAGPAQGRWVTSMTRAIEQDDQRVGVVVAVISIEQLHAFQRSLVPGDRDTSGLVTAQGIALTRTPYDETVPGQDLSNGPLFERLRTADDGLYLAEALIDGERRISAYTRVPEFSLVAYVGLSEADRLASWTLLAIVEIILASFVLVAIGLGTIFLDRSYRAREKLASERQSTLRALAEATAMLVASEGPATLMARLDAVLLAIVPHRRARALLFSTHGSETTPPLSGGGGIVSAPIVKPDGKEVGLIEAVTSGRGQEDADLVWALRQLGALTGLVLERLEAAMRINEALQRAEAESEEADRARGALDAIYSTLTDAVVAFDSRWHIIYANPATLALTQRGADRLMGRLVWQLFPGLLGTPFEDELRRAAAARERATFEFYYAPEALWFSVNAFPQELGMTAMLRDVTAQKDTEAQLRQSQRMEAVGQLTGGVAHDFNNLLTVIIGNIDDLLEDRSERDPATSQLRMALKAAERAAELTQRLLAFSRKQALDPRAVDINGLLGQLEPLVQRTMGDAIDIVFILDKAIDRAMVDAGQLESALLNLAINALHAMPEGGKLTIETSMAYLDRDYAGSRLEVAEGHYICISVTDTGSGMTPDVLERVFEPFFTTKPAGLGTGLGLSMAYGFVKQSKGHISIYSEPAMGTTVRIYLPRARVEGVEARQLPEAVAVPTGSERILVVEDEALVRHHAVNILTGLGYHVVVVEDGTGALAALDGQEVFDLLLVDVVLGGGLTGRQISEAAQALQEGIKVLFMSGYTENAIVHHGRLDQGVHLLGKPFRKADIAKKVRAVLDE
ncbi:PAS domain S-box-containing protein [Devosia enhydra]|uniref:histidine kinase n=1 Tax=Devosia enhydra TaxID=665118 RepID=A0A1K2HU31_9HYPH|nr:ATP-binding protein [Devosia enhydra]SFZ81907.1 PAS domain S-box-containing protein [Devosia enhydra]